jgi:hypothetical protein
MAGLNLARRPGLAGHTNQTRPTFLPAAHTWHANTSAHIGYDPTMSGK